METRNHLVQCKSEIATEWHDEVMTELPKLLLQLHTKLEVTRSLVICVRKALGLSLHDEKGTDKIIQGQKKLTMEAMFDGFFIRIRHPFKTCIYGRRVCGLQRAMEHNGLFR
eukprot:4525375-Ditylum_brightwellii.AAC.2